VSFLSLEGKLRKVTIFSEGQNTWPHLKGVLDEILSNTQFHVSYVTSSINDPGLKKNHSKLNSFYVGDGILRNIFFKNVECDFFICTTPDLNFSKFVRSKKKSTYIYVPHSIVSLHMIYNTHAFDHFDVLCCVGPHHLKEARQLEKLNKSKKKQLLKFGYRNIKQIHFQKKANKNNLTKAYQTVLIAPSWGKKALIESGKVLDLIRTLLKLNIKVILRPHPETFKRFPIEIKKIESEFVTNKKFFLDQKVSSFASMKESEVLITDWSGTSMEYAFGFKKPVIFCDINKKINNPYYEKLGITPVEISLRSKIGIIWDMHDDFASVLDKLSSFDSSKINDLYKSLIFSDYQVNTSLSRFLMSY
jgi:YidC/Oxa1 family membrane protein insertase